MKALFLNGSPRKNGNTAQMLCAAMDGARSAGAETELVDLYDYINSGCKSCFACKMKNSKTNGLCVIRDDIRPILEKALNAEVLILGSPVYYGSASAQMRAFLERLLYPNLSYSVDEQGRTLQIAKRKMTGLIFSMICSEDMLEPMNYPVLLGSMENYLNYIFGYSESLYSCEAMIFSDYSRYEANSMNIEELTKHHEEQFPVDLKRAFEMGYKLTVLAAGERTENGD